MIIDSQLELSNEQAVTASAASTNYVDLGANNDPGLDNKTLYLAITCKEAAAAAGAATVNFKLQKDSASDFSGAEDVYDSGAIGKAALVLGYQLFIPIPVGTDKRYLRAYFEVGTGPLTAGKFDAQIVADIPHNIAKPDAL